MGLLSIRSGVERITLDEAWAEAETIGEVQVTGGRFDGPYEARICFENGASLIYAYGKGRTPTAALMLAIDEARRIGGRR